MYLWLKSNQRRGSCECPGFTEPGGQCGHGPGREGRRCEMWGESHAGAVFRVWGHRTLASILSKGEAAAGFQERGVVTS